MKDVLAAPSRPILEAFACSNVVLAFDYDGTLAPIVPERGEARMRRRTRQLLAEVCNRYPCAVISGRSRPEVLALLEGVRVRCVVGNHGLEPSADMATFEKMVDAMRPPLARALGSQSGIEIEDKRFSVAIHYRKSRTKRAARRAIAAAVSALPVEVRVIPGKLVINLLPPGAPNKGIALEAVRRDLRADTAIYVGDDATDEDVFALDQPGRLLCVRVGRKRVSSAQYFVRDQRSVDALLGHLARIRLPAQSKGHAS